MDGVAGNEIMINQGVVSPVSRPVVSEAPTAIFREPVSEIAAEPVSAPEEAMENLSQEADFLVESVESEEATTALEKFANGEDLDDMPKEESGEEVIEKDSGEEVKVTVSARDESVLDASSDDGETKTSLELAQANQKIEELSEKVEKQAIENKDLRTRFEAYGSMAVEDLLFRLLKEAKLDEKERVGALEMLLSIFLKAFKIMIDPEDTVGPTARQASHA